MAVISPKEEQLFQEIANRLAPTTGQISRSRAFARFRRFALIAIWMVSLIGTFGAVEGQLPFMACVLSLIVATFAIWSDIIASPEAWAER